MGKDGRSRAETQANHLSGRQEENRSRSAGTVGEGQGGEEEIGGVEPTVKRLLLPLYFVPIQLRRRDQPHRNRRHAVAKNRLSRAGKRAARFPPRIDLISGCG